MTREPDFERSADMRLLELQRTALGLAPRDLRVWETRYAIDGIPGIDTELPVPQRQTPVVAVELQAVPAADVIPGAVVTLALGIANEGAATASGIIAAAPLPGGCAYRQGSFIHNGCPASDEHAERFFGQGLAVEDLAPNGRATFVWKIGVRLGAEPLVVAPQVRSAAAVIGARPLSIRRQVQSTTAFTKELAHQEAAMLQPRPLIPADIPAGELPFYELDEEEQLVYEAADAALSDAAAPTVVPSASNETDEVERLPPEPVREGVVRYGKFDRATLAFFERTFSGSKEPTILQHCIFAGALACATGVDGADAAALKRHLDAQSQVLHRIALHEKLGKKEPISEYAGRLLAELDTLAPAPVPPRPVSSSTALVLVAEFSEPTLAVIAKIARERERWDFVKARQLTLALQAQRAQVDDEATSASIENALRRYAQVSMTALQKLFVRVRIDRTTGILFAHEPALDVAAREVLAALGAALPFAKLRVT
jgi:hypothetical protein